MPYDDGMRRRPYSVQGGDGAVKKIALRAGVGKEYLIRLTRTELRLVSADVLPCQNKNFVNIAGIDERRALMRKICAIMTAAAKEG